MTTLAWTILAFVIGVAMATGVVMYAEARRKGNVSTEIWDKIRSIIDETLLQSLAVYQADQLGYDALIDYSVNYLKNKVNSAEFLTPTEKDILTPELIRSILEPQLKKLLDKKV